MMSILLTILVHFAAIQKLNAQLENSAVITFPTEPWKGCGIRNVGGIDMGSTASSASDSVCTCTHSFHSV